MALIIQVFLSTMLFLSVQAQQSPTGDEINQSQLLTVWLTTLLKNAARLSHPITTRLNDVLGNIGEVNQNEPYNHYDSYERSYEKPYESGSKNRNPNNVGRYKLHDVSHEPHRRRVNDRNDRRRYRPSYDYEYDYDYDYDYRAPRYGPRGKTNVHPISSHDRKKIPATVPVKINDKKILRTQNNVAAARNKMNPHILTKIQNKDQLPSKSKDETDIQQQVVYVVLNPEGASPDNTLDLIKNHGLKVNTGGVSSIADELYIVPVEAISAAPHVNLVSATPDYDTSLIPNVLNHPVGGTSADR